jgi:beta-mannosidase
MYFGWNWIWGGWLMEATFGSKLHDTQGRIALESWTFRSLNKSVVIPNATVPGTSHMHLMQAGIIEDPYLGFNEIKYQWIAQETWVYETSFHLDAKECPRSKLLFQNLDGVAHIYLNDEHLTTAINAFIPHMVEAEKLMKTSNNLTIIFEPPLEYAKRQAKNYPYYVPATVNYNVWAEPTNRVFIRKAGSDFGWDWGPAYATTGIAAPVYVQVYRPEIVMEDFRVLYNLKKDLSKAELVVEVTVDAKEVSHGNIDFRLFINGELRSSIQEYFGYKSKTKFVQIKYTLDNPKLWWPIGYGDAYLYNFRVEMGASGFAPKSIVQKVGIRSIELVQDDIPGTICSNKSETCNADDGKSFYFRINGVPVFCKGANWIPSDSFSTRVKNDNIRFLLESAKEANMNTIRVWGGGRYESDFFYEECDRLGFLIWQELMFACAMYPRDQTFLENVQKEVEFQIRRLSKYTSIALYGANNENELMMDQFGSGQHMPNGQTFNRDVGVVDFVKLFIDIVHPIVFGLDKTRPFVDTSPSNGLFSQEPFVKKWGDANSYFYGDIHYYNNSADCHDYRMFPQARFVSEYGFQSMPSLASLLEVSQEKDWASVDTFWKFLLHRERHENGTIEMIAQMSKHFVIPDPFGESSTPNKLTGRELRKHVDSLLYLSQIQQAKCYETAIRTWRRGKNMALGNTMGILYWQLNDIWQGTSWSSLEFNGDWKSLMYTVKREFDPFIVTIHQESREKSENEVVIYGVSDLTEAISINLVIQVRKTDSGAVVSTQTLNFKIESLKSKELTRLSIPSILSTNHSAPICSETTCFLLILYTANDVIKQVEHFFAPYKNVVLGNGEIKVNSCVELKDQKGFEVEIENSRFVALFVELVVSGKQVKGFWDENSFFMLPNTKKKLFFTTQVRLSGKEFKQKLRIRWLQNIYQAVQTAVE